MLKIIFVIQFFLYHITNCINPCDFTPIISDLGPSSCYVRQVDDYFWSYDETDCIPRCESAQVDQPLPPCQDFYDALNSNAQLLARPTCQRDNYYAPKQCKGQPTTGRCFCSDPDGNRLDGQQWWKNAEKVTCNCSRKKFDMRQSANYYYVSLHCNTHGDYEPLQCDVTNELCWCADESSGKLLSHVVPMSARSLLTCYDPLKYGTEYLRQCESQAYAQSYILDKLANHGTLNLLYGTFLCDEDGSYGRYKVLNGQTYCTWKDNINIGSYQMEENNTTNCNCARDEIIFKQIGQERKEKCLGNGNYQMFQIQGNEGYCVDDDGYRFSANISTRPEECTNLLPQPNTYLKQIGQKRI